MKTSSASLLVKIERREDGGILSSLRFPSPADQETLMSWPTGGMHQTSTALLVEALRREILLTVLVKMSSGTQKESISEKEIDSLVRGQVLFNMEKIMPSLIEETLSSMRSSQ
jgi:hypothetical protein